MSANCKMEPALLPVERPISDSERRWRREIDIREQEWDIRNRMTFGKRSAFQESMLWIGKGVLIGLVFAVAAFFLSK
ncbi:MAG: hypothetical protein PHI18_07905 [bacterium]|nr:hypothetical protein [bacterium]